MTPKVGPVPEQTDNKRGIHNAVQPIGPRYADFMMARPRILSRPQRGRIYDCNYSNPSRTSIRLYLREESIYAC